MATIPNQDKIANELYEAALKSREGKRRNYLGMSAIGHVCERKLWLDFRGFKTNLSGRMLMLFKFGDLIESEIKQHLASAGYKIEGEQMSFEDFDGFFKGHCDGIIHGVTKKPHILEVKSANDAKFKSFKMDGVRKTYPIYYAQVQCYMGYAQLERALFVIQNKNTSEIYTERIHFNESDFQDLRKKAFRIITGYIPEMLGKIKECFFCDQKHNCAGDNNIMSDRICNTCHYFNVFSPGVERLASWCFNEKHPYRLYKTEMGCPDWNDKFEKGPVRDKRLNSDDLKALLKGGDAMA